MSDGSNSEGLRRAIRWLSDEGRHDTAAIDEAALRFDLTPADTTFLLAHLREPNDAKGEPGDGS